MEALQSLYSSASHAAQIASPTALQHSRLERLHLAMMLSLFAVGLLLIYVYISLIISQAADAKVQSEATGQDMAHLRPEGFGYLLDLINIIMGQSDASFVPLEKLDAAQFTLLRWGNFIPWAWSTWNDQRIANAECLRSLVCISSGLFSREINCCLQTATWLYHLNAPIFQKSNVALNRKISEVDLHAILHADIFSSSLMISVRFLLYISRFGFHLFLFV